MARKPIYIKTMGLGGLGLTVYYESLERAMGDQKWKKVHWGVWMSEDIGPRPQQIVMATIITDEEE